MAKYICTRYPHLRIGSSICFENGYYETKSVDEERQIERSDGYKVHITKVLEAEPEEKDDGSEDGSARKRLRLRESAKKRGQAREDVPEAQGEADGEGRAEFDEAELLN